MTENGIDDAFPDTEDMAWTALIECEQCGDGGRMHSTGKPHDYSVWECETCGEETVHKTVIKSPDGVVPNR